MAKFEVGKTYFTRSIVDADTIVELKVLSRTAKTIRAKTTRGEHTLRISEYEGVEQVAPFGRYSMCAIIGADRELGKEEEEANDPNGHVQFTDDQVLKVFAAEPQASADVYEVLTTLFLPTDIAHVEVMAATLDRLHHQGNIRCIARFPACDPLYRFVRGVSR